MLHLLGRCNLTCRHCYMGGGPLRTESLRLDSVVAAIAEAGALGIGNLYLTGGEPTLYSGLSDVLEVASRDSGLETVLCTNATLTNARLVSTLTRTRCRVHVSVDGDEAFHDYFRNLPGSFRSSEKGVRRFVDAGLPVTIVATISRDNLASLATIAQWSAAIGAAKFRVQPLLKLGRGLDIVDHCLTTEELNLLILQLTDLGNRYSGQLDCGMIGVTKRFLLAHPCGAYVCNGAGCHRRVAKEIKKVVVREDGTVLPEVTNLSHAFALGHIDEAPLSSLVARYFADGYEKFDRLCRSTYNEVVADWKDAVIPWDQIVAERSYSSNNWSGVTPAETQDMACGSCS